MLYTFNLRMQEAGTRASLWATDQPSPCIELQVGQSCTGTACSQNKQTNKTYIFRVSRSISRTHTKSYISHYRISILLNSLQRSEENLCDFFLPSSSPSSFLSCLCFYIFHSEKALLWLWVQEMNLPAHYPAIEAMGTQWDWPKGSTLSSAGLCKHFLSTGPSVPL